MKKPPSSPKGKVGRPVGACTGPTAATEARIEHVAGLMRSLEFRTGKTVVALAAEWGITEKYARQITSMASKRVAAEFAADQPRVATKIGTALEEVIDDSITEMRKGDAKSRKDVIDAGKVLAVLVGANAATKVQVGPLDKLSDDELEAKAQELLARMHEDIDGSGDGEPED